MFSGIIETEANVAAVKMVGTCKLVRIEKRRGWKLTVGESISVDGICSTVVRVGKSFFEVEYMPETLTKTTAASFKKSSTLNLERSLAYGDRIHGHFVAGHIDTTARISDIKKSGRSRLIRFQVPKELSRYLVSRGSIAVNGVALTVALRNDTSFTVALIPHTLKVTNLRLLKVGDAVNIELDMLSRYSLAPMGASGRVSLDAKKKAKKTR